MKTKSVVLLSIVALAFAGFAEAAKPKKRTRNANRVGAYGVGFAGINKLTSDSADEAALALFILQTLEPEVQQNPTETTDESGIGYQAAFGYRFNRYFAAEIGLVQLGDTSATAAADMDFGDGEFLRATSKVSFSTGGPLMSAVGILPINDRFEFFGRVGYLFTAAEREILLRVDGQNAGFGSSKGDSQDIVFGVGATYHFNQVYSARLEYLQFDSLGEEDRSGIEDLNMIGLGIVVRF